MYKIDRRGGGRVQKSFSRKLPKNVLGLFFTDFQKYLDYNFFSFLQNITNCMYSMIEMTIEGS